MRSAAEGEGAFGILALIVADHHCFAARRNETRLDYQGFGQAGYPTHRGGRRAGHLTARAAANRVTVTCKAIRVTRNVTRPPDIVQAIGALFSLRRGGNGVALG